MGDRRLDSLFRRYRTRGDVAALGQLFDAAAPELLRVARHLCPDEAAAEDVLQATFETALEKGAEFEEGRRVLPWMLGILAHHARKARRQAARVLDPERLPDRAPADPAVLAADREFDALVESAVAELPPQYASVVGSYLRRDRRPAQIADELGISANAAGVRLHRGLKLLRRAIPAGAALGGAAALRLDPGAQATRGVTAVRARVLELAAAKSTAATAALSAAAAAPSTTSATLGATLVQKPILTAALAAVLAGGGVYALKSSPGAPRDRTLDAQLADLTAQLDEARSALRARDAADSAALVAPPPTRAAAPSEAAEASATELPSTPTNAEWLARLTEAKSWREALAIGYQIAALDPDEGLAVMQAIYADIPAFEYRQQILKPFVFHGGHVHALEILHLAATDEHTAVQGWAWGYLENYAFQSFAEDHAAYAAWRARFAGLPLGAVLEQNARELVGRVAGMSDDELLRMFEVSDRLDLRAGDVGGVDLSAVLGEAGLLSIVERWLVSSEDEVREGALTWIGSVSVDEAFLRRSIFPLTGGGVEPGVRSRALRLLGDPANGWAFEHLLDELVRSGTRADGRPTDAAQALAELGDPRSIPAMIGLIAADDTYRTRYGIGYFGLGKLTGVDYHEDHGGAFWLDWWERNRGSLPPEVRAMELPTYTIAQ